MATRNTHQVTIPLAAGLDTKRDPRSPSNKMDVCRDVQFDQIGGAQTRKPFAAMSNSILGGGTLSNCRRIIPNGDELLVATSDTLYSYSAAESAWVSRGTHLAIASGETDLFATNHDQSGCDRAELGGVQFFTWAGDLGAATYLAARDATTGAIILAPTVIAVGGLEPHLTALSTRVLLTFVTASGLVCVALDPANVATSAIVAPTLITALVAAYDIVKIPAADTAFVAAALATGVAYVTSRVTAALAITSHSQALATGGPIACTVDPTAALATVVRSDGLGAIRGDQITVSTLLTSVTSTAVGTYSGTPNHIALSYRSVQNSGIYRAYAFWTSAETTAPGTNWTSKFNWVAGFSTGTEANFIRVMGLASRAFDYNGSVYVWGVFAGATTVSAGIGGTQLQNTCFLYRDDASLVAKAVVDRAGGLLPAGILPGVALTSGTTGFSWCATIRRIVPTAKGGNDYAGRAPCDVAFTFDSNDARRVSRLGQSLYLSGALVEQYDGVRLVEVGFAVYPWAVGTAKSGVGSIADGVYAYKVVLKYTNARGEVERSTTATVSEVAMSGGPAGVTVTTAECFVTKKLTVPPTIEVYRTAVSPTDSAPFYLVTGQDPTVTTGDNAYVVNDPTSFTTTMHDAYADATLITKQEFIENGALLENLAPPSATVMFATDDRIFLAGVAGDPDRVWYSQQRRDGYMASFNDALVTPVPRDGGDITALAYLNETLVVFREHAIYALPGIGFDNFGNGNNFGPANRISSDVGAVSMESVALTPMGLVFKSAKGWYLLDRSWACKYIGLPVASFDSDTVYAAHVVESQHQVRIVTSARMLTWDYLVDEWSEWTISDGVHACMWNGTYVYLTATGPKTEQTTYTSLTYGVDVETSWTGLNGIMGYGGCYKILPIGEYRSSHLLRIRVARDYQYDGSGNVVWFDDIAWAPTPATVGSVLQVRHTPSQKRGEAYKVRLTAVSASSPKATLATTSIGVRTSGAVWTATLQATAPGEMGNLLTFSIAFVTGSPFAIEVHDNATYDTTLGKWQSLNNNVGVLVTLSVSSAPTVVGLETALASGSTLLSVLTHDPNPGNVISTANIGAPSTVQFAGGSYTAPTGEALRLTAIGLEVGIKGPLTKRLPASQKA